MMPLRCLHFAVGTGSLLVHLWHAGGVDVVVGDVVEALTQNGGWWKATVVSIEGEDEGGVICKTSVMRRDGSLGKPVVREVRPWVAPPVVDEDDG